MRKPKPTSRAPKVPAAASPARAPTYDDLLAIARLVESSARFAEVRLRSGDIEVEVKRAPQGAAPVAAIAAPAAPVAAPAGAPAPKAAVEIPDGAHVVRSPMVGTFFCAPEPGAKPFVVPGTKVKAESIVCIIEVMKLMNSVPAGVAGVVTHVFVENAQPVEPGQPIVAIRPSK